MDCPQDRGCPVHETLEELLERDLAAWLIAKAAIARAKDGARPLCGN